MNSIAMKALPIMFLLLSLTGCWDSKELTEFGFIMGISLDQTEEGTIEINAQSYSPTETTGGMGGTEKTAYTNIKTINESVFDGVRDINRYLGRLPRWSHMRVILIGEQFAKEHDIGEILDFFNRNEDVRLTTLVIVTNGNAADYLTIKPFIERTVSQQLQTIIESSTKYAGKTIKASILDIDLQLKSKAKTALIPYFKMNEEQQQAPYSSGVAIISKGKMVELLEPRDVQEVLMLMNKFKSGMLEFPCLDDGSQETSKMETLETSLIKTKITPKFTMKPPTIHMLTKIEGTIGELRCTTITNVGEEKKLEDHIKNIIEEKIESVIERMQEEKVDVLGIGNKLYQQDPALWKKWEKEWEDIFADIQFIIDVEVNLRSTGMPIGEKVTGE
ncbi:Ger(x)C family spore germination protein [Bacillus sp. ISL-46]|uniref:Ger(x)C family spore germination protein n=1 Tax=Bacillus sp. ISL-46 TaxID=2819129 RepID=UPI001BE775E3|nr:Ger(x)C family spore germination protein [Bacillus sp. ISL-46]MBT2725195.1 Ger(x)C family spore germination protein [Bacillus sp. ISL-46]